MALPSIVAEYRRAYGIFGKCTVHSILCDMYRRYDYDSGVHDILITLVGMDKDKGEEEAIKALERMGLGPVAMKDMEELLGEFFIQHAADIFSHLQVLSWYQKNLTSSGAMG